MYFDVRLPGYLQGKQFDVEVAFEHAAALATMAYSIVSMGLLVSACSGALGIARDAVEKLRMEELI